MSILYFDHSSKCKVLNAMCLMGIPGSNNVASGSGGITPSVVPGLRAAVEALAESSPQQQNRVHRDSHILNRFDIYFSEIHI